MKFRSRLIVSFCIIIFMPILLAIVVFYSVDRIQGAYLDQSYLTFFYNTTRAMTPDVHRFFWDLIGSILIVLVITSVFLVTWIYRGLVPNTRKLIHAAEEISKGNLDEPIIINGHDEIAELANSIETMRRHLKADAIEKLEQENTQRQLISNIAHDLKTPLTSIRGYSEALLDGVASTPEKQNVYLRTIYNKSVEMNTLLNELSTYSKLDANRIPYNFQHLYVRDFFGDCVEELSMDLEMQGVKLGYESYLEDDVEVIADPEQLMRVIHNLVNNAVKYRSDEQPYVNIRLKDVGNYVQVEIEDNGKGIGADELPKIFDRTFRGDSARTSTAGGSGIGLSIVHKIVEDHGGHIWATSKPGYGTVFTFILCKYQLGGANEQSNSDY
ncbi:MAG: HAMP domain-containing histidine kinase [Lachnospiraceae bacterium]|nr:HAMP domain-containing histidine kinase [Lachnospiraceae bacterium]